MFERGKGRGKLYKYIIISIMKEKNKKVKRKIRTPNNLLLDHRTDKLSTLIRVFSFIRLKYM